MLVLVADISGFEPRTIFLVGDRHVFACLLLPFVVIRELIKQQRQRERHLKINVWDYFVIIFSSPYHLLSTEHAVNALVETAAQLDF